MSEHEDSSTTRVVGSRRSELVGCIRNRPRGHDPRDRIAPVMVTSIGAASIPSIIVVTVLGWLLCLFLAELSAMMPERTGGSPSYAYPAYKDRWPRVAEHINGFTAWAYWLGWFPVGPLNMILASFYIVDKFDLSQKGFTPIHTPIAWWTLVISIVGLVLLFIPAYMGIRFGACSPPCSGSSRWCR